MPYEKPVVLTRSYDIQAGGITSVSRTAHTAFVQPPLKVVGQWITLVGGTKFRKSTSYARSKAWVELGSAQNDTGLRRNISSSPLYTVWCKSGNGGWNPDAYLTSHYHSAFTSATDIGYSSGGIQASPGIPTLSGNEAKTKALLKIADGKANLGENLGTLGQTMRMLKHPITTLCGGIKSVWDNKSLRPFIRESLESLQRKGLLTTAAERYLEFVYGWKPLMQDIHGLIEFAKQTGQLDLLLSGEHTAVRSQASSKSWTNVSDKVETALTGTSTSKVHCKLYAQLDPNWQGTRALNQLGLANPLALAWELTSLSFVVDWLLPIGPVLNALTAPAGLTFVNGSISNRVSFYGSYTDLSTHCKSRANYQYNGGPTGSGNVRYEGYSRDSLSKWPIPGFWVDPDPLRGDRTLKALALLIASTRRYR